MKPCPACRREVQDSQTECPYCGVVFSKFGKLPVKAGFGSDQPPYITSKNSESQNQNSEDHKKKRSKKNASIVVFIGIATGFLLSGDPSLGFFSIIFSIAGLAYFAKAKNRSSAWGLCGLGGPIGAIVGYGILLSISDRRPSLTKKDGSSIRWVGGVVVVLLLMQAAISIPPYIKYTKRSRTSEAMKHVKRVHEALADWYAAPHLGDGVFLSATTDDDAAPGTHTFSDHFPEEAGWLNNGNEHYTYSFTETMREDGQSIPEVIATAKNNAAVYAEVIVSMASGESTVFKVSHSY